MNIKFTKEVTLTENDIKDIIIKHLYEYHNLSGIFDVNFLVVNKPIQSTVYFQDTIDIWVFNGAKIKVSENET